MGVWWLRFLRENSNNRRNDSKANVPPKEILTNLKLFLSSSHTLSADLGDNTHKPESKMTGFRKRKEKMSFK
jgi:hypothetical protein